MSTVDWTRVAVRMQNEARQLLEGGEARLAALRYREARESLPLGKPALDALIHYGLAEALAETGDLPGAARCLARSLYRNKALGNAEGIDACRRLRARLHWLRGRAVPDAPERLRLFIILEMGVRPVQRRLASLGRAPRVLLLVWDRLPLRELHDGTADASKARAAYLFNTDRLREARTRTAASAQVHLAWRAVPKSRSRVRLELVEDLGGGDRLGRALTLSRKGSTFTIEKEELLSV